MFIQRDNCLNKSEQLLCQIGNVHSFWEVRLSLTKFYLVWHKVSDMENTVRIKLAKEDSLLNITPPKAPNWQVIIYSTWVSLDGASDIEHPVRTEFTKDSLSAKLDNYYPTQSACYPD